MSTPKNPYNATNSRTGELPESGPPSLDTTASPDETTDDSSETDDVVWVTETAQRMYRCQFADEECNPGPAWDKGVTIEPAGFDADEVRLHLATRMVLLRRDDTVRALFRLCRLSPDEQQAISHAIRDIVVDGFSGDREVDDVEDVANGAVNLSATYSGP